MAGMPQTQTKDRAPTLYAIIVFKLIDGLLFVGVAVAIYTNADKNLPVEFQNLLHALRLNPERKFWTDLALKVDSITAAKMVHAAVGTLVYSLFTIVEGVGMMFRIKWAGWLSIWQSAFFIPIEIYELNHEFTWLVFVILVCNVIIVWYLYQNRDRLFHAHLHRR